jgi:hypothetical protein
MLRSNSRRFAAAPIILRVMAAVLFVLVLITLWQGTEILVRETVEANLSEKKAWTHIREHMFWMLTLPILVLCYTTFESFYRSSDTRFLSLLPIDGRRYVNAVIGRAYLAHLPLFIPAASYAFHLNTFATEALASYALLWTVLTFAMSIPLSLSLHIAAGNSSVGGDSRLKSYLSSGVIANDSAFLLYSPVAALAAILGVGIFSDFVLFESIVTGRANLLWAPIAWSCGLTLLAWKTARNHAGDRFFAIFAKFSEAEAPLSYGDDGIPLRDQRLFFETLAQGESRLYFERDDKQLRRRYRLDKILLGVLALILLRLNAGEAEETQLFLNCLVPMLGFTGLLLIASFRTHGGELQSPWLQHSLPHRGLPQWWGGYLADLVYPFWAWSITAIFCFAYGPLKEAIWATLVGLVGTLVLVGLARLLARMGETGRSLFPALIWRLSCLSLFGVALWQW